MSDTTIQEFSSCLFEVSDKLSDIEYKNLYELLGKINTEKGVENEAEANEVLQQENMNLYRQNNRLMGCFNNSIERERELKQTNRDLKEKNGELKNENNNFRAFICDMTSQIFTKNINGIGDKMRRKIYKIFNDTSEEVRGIWKNSYYSYIEYELNTNNGYQWYNTKKSRLYFGDK